jgi:hypothetical protein
LVTATKAVFDGDYYNPDFRNVHVDIEFPVDSQAYPGLWVNFSPTADLHVIGIGHVEFEDNNDDTVTPHTRWEFQGIGSWTVTALSSWERDRLLDEFVRVLAFGPESDSTTGFRSTIEDNPLLALNMNFDQFSIGGEGANPGTPWGSDDVIYEYTVSIEVTGEFISSAAHGSLVPLTDIIVTPYTDPPGDPTPSW